MTDSPDSPLSLLSDSPFASGKAFERSLIAALIQAGAEELIELEALRAQGWRAESLDDHFRWQRYVADHADAKLNEKWFLRMKQILAEIDDHAQFVPNQGPLHFLDLGCCPGGFSSYIMDKNPNAVGLGISLPPASGGHASLLHSYHHRMQVLFQDLTNYQLGPQPIKDKGLQVLPFDVRSRRFDLVILDGHLLRTHTQSTGRPWDHSRLLISQLIIALRAVKCGGTVVLKLSKPERLWTAKILYMLDTLSSRLVVRKPRSMHATRATFYAVAQGFCLTPDARERRSKLLDGFQRLWVELTFGEAEGQGRYMQEGEHDFIVQTEYLLERYLPRLRELGSDPWLTQTAALRRWYQAKGIDINSLYEASQDVGEDADGLDFID